LKLLIASDLHFEFHMDGGKSFIEENFYQDDYDILILAGDIQVEAQLEKTILELSKVGKPVVFVPGNHEYYGASFPLMERTLKVLNTIPNINALSNSSVEIDSVRFVGTTLWFHHSKIKEPLDNLMNCFKHIKGLTEMVGDKCKEASSFLDDNVRAGDVVITHYLPHENSIHPNYKPSNINRYYLTNVAPIVEDREAKLWVHGHTHKSSDYLVNKTRVVCNPFGYIGLETNQDFTRKIVEI
jgi:predicted phosphodiesterase